MTGTTESNTQKAKRRNGRKVQIWLSWERYWQLCIISGKGTVTETIDSLIENAAKKSGSTPLARPKK